MESSTHVRKSTDTRNWKLIQDPFLRKGLPKLYRYDGVVAGNSSNNVLHVSDPRPLASRFASRNESADLPVPNFAIDSNYVGRPAQRELAFFDLNDNVNEQFLREMCKKCGVTEEVEVFYHPTTKRHSGVARAVFLTEREARTCMDKYNQTTVMGSIVKVVADPWGKRVKEAIKQLSSQSQSSTSDQSKWKARSEDGGARPQKTPPVSSATPISHVPHPDDPSSHSASSHPPPPPPPAPAGYPPFPSWPPGGPPPVWPVGMPPWPMPWSMPLPPSYAPPVQQEPPHNQHASSSESKTKRDKSASPSRSHSRASRSSSRMDEPSKDKRRQDGRSRSSRHSHRRRPSSSEELGGKKDERGRGGRGRGRRDSSDESGTRKHRKGERERERVVESVDEEEEYYRRQHSDEIEEYQYYRRKRRQRKMVPRKAPSSHLQDKFEAITSSEDEENKARPAPPFGKLERISCSSDEEHAGHSRKRKKSPAKRSKRTGRSKRSSASWSDSEGDSSEDGKEQRRHQRRRHGDSEGKQDSLESRIQQLLSADQFRVADQAKSTPLNDENNSRQEKTSDVEMSLSSGEEEQGHPTAQTGKAMETNAYPPGSYFCPPMYMYHPPNYMPPLPTVAGYPVWQPPPVAPPPSQPKQISPVSDSKARKRATERAVSEVRRVLKEVLQKDIVKRAVEASVFQSVDTWFARKESQHKTSEISSSHHAPVAQPLSTLFDSRGSAPSLTGVPGLGLRASLPKLPSFKRKAVRPSTPPGRHRSKSPSSSSSSSSSASSATSSRSESESESEEQPVVKSNRPRLISVSSTSSSGTRTSVKPDREENEKDSEREGDWSEQSKIDSEDRSEPVRVDIEERETVEDDQGENEAAAAATAAQLRREEGAMCVENGVSYHPAHFDHHYTDRVGQTPPPGPMEQETVKAQKQSRPAVVFKPREQADQLRICYEFLQSGIDQEDIEYLKMTVDELTSEGRAYAPYLRWAPHVATAEPVGRKRLTADEIPAHKTGCARTEGFYRLPQKENRIKSRPRQAFEYTEAQNQQHMHMAKQQVQLSREARNMQRRLLTTLGSEVDSDLLKYNHLKFRKKLIKFARSGIHGWGLFAMEDIAQDEMIVEYVGQKVRITVAEKREKKYEKMGVGSSYLFRIDNEMVVDATKRGNIARFINHSCNPNCYAKIITVEGEKRIVIYSKQNINRGEEVTYDYKFPLEDEKIPCNCGAPCCRGSLN